MACIITPQCNFLHGYFRCLLPEEIIGVEVKVKTMKGIHKFRRDCTTHIISYKPLSPRLCHYLSLVRKMQTCLELKDKDFGQPHSSSNQTIRPTISSLQKAPDPRKAIYKKQKKRSKIPIRKQFKVRLIEKPLSPTMLCNPNFAYKRIIGISIQDLLCLNRGSLYFLYPLPSLPKMVKQEVPNSVTQINSLL